uniref:MALT paracaspase 2 n=1 Tax=Latimeria chalumnae TaxID=7897 RepID=H3B0U4_LATCH
MSGWSLPVGSLGETALARLAELLDKTIRGWRKLAEVAGADKRYKCRSDEELECCSLRVLSPDGSPSRRLLQLLAERACPNKHLLSSLERMGHTEAAQFLTTTVNSTIRLTVQPVSQCVAEGKRVSLMCQATGPPGLEYQWFVGNQEDFCPLGDQVWLILSSMAVIIQYFLFSLNIAKGSSQWAHLDQIDPSFTCIFFSFFLASSYCPTMVGLQVAVQPRPQSLREGGPMELECSAFGNPPPQYQWFKDGRQMMDAKLAQFKVQRVTSNDQGRYCCKVFNLFHEVWSSEVEVEIETGSSSMPQCNRRRQESGCYATDKVALLIGNMNYLYHKQLKAPMVDVHELTNLLRQLSFKVVSLLDLTRDEMQRAVSEFLLLLDKGVYGLLYFAGHGYENYGNSFMVPVDAPSSYTSEHCLCVQNILHHMQERQTGLNIFLLDMCRKRNVNDDIIPQVGVLRVTANIVFGYATCVDAEAYEVNQGELSNGIFISFLKQRLLEDEKITVLLDKVAEDMGKCEITQGRQALELRSNLSERRALTDDIKLPDCLEEYSARNLQWTKAHALPDSQYLQFDCGARVQLGYAAEFSNILIIFTRIVETPVEVVRCDARLTDFSEDLDVDLKLTNKENLEETGSILFTFRSFDFSDCCHYTRLNGLQKLKKELAFTVCLQYQYRGMDDYIEERREVNIDKPLVSKLNLH